MTYMLFFHTFSATNRIFSKKTVTLSTIIGLYSLETNSRDKYSSTGLKKAIWPVLCEEIWNNADFEQLLLLIGNVVYLRGFPSYGGHGRQ